MREVGLGQFVALGLADRGQGFESQSIAFRLELILDGRDAVLGHGAEQVQLHLDRRIGHRVAGHGRAIDAEVDFVEPVPQRVGPYLVD
jgi:hypothetical protein